MTRLIRNTAILAKLETTAGTDAVPTGTDDAMLISNASFEYQVNNVDRALLRGYLGASEQLVGTRFVKASFECEITGSGTAGTAPVWGRLLQACAFAEETTATYAAYKPVSTGMKTATIQYADDGLIHTMLGCMGNVEFAMGEGERPLFKFNFLGIDGGVAEGANPSQTLTAWKSPLVVTDPNSGDIKFGGTYAAGVLTGGTSYMSRGLSLNMGNDVKTFAMLGGQSVGVTDRQVTGSLQLELSAAEDVALITSINANALASLSFEHGTTAGYKVAFFAPAVQRINYKKADYQGRRNSGMELRLTPLAGNDELVILAY